MLFSQLTDDSINYCAFKNQFVWFWHSMNHMLINHEKWIIRCFFNLILDSKRQQVNSKLFVSQQVDLFEYNVYLIVHLQLKSMENSQAEEVLLHSTISLLFFLTTHLMIVKIMYPSLESNGILFKL